MNIPEELKKLNLKQGSFVVIGSGIMSALGLRDAKDIDVVVDKKNYEKFKQLGWSEKKHDDETSELIKDIFGIKTSWDSQNSEDNLDDLLGDSIVFDDINYVSPERLLRWKMRMYRDKDKLDIRLLQEYLLNQT